MAPPFRLTFSSYCSNQPSCLIQLSACAANASLNSASSISSIVIPARFNAFCVAGTGPKPMIAASQPATPIDLIRARGVRPSAFARSADISNIADAPSEIAEDVPAVTVPLTGSNTGRRPAKVSTVVSGRITSSWSMSFNTPSVS